MAFIKYDRNLSIVCFPYQDESGYSILCHIICVIIEIIEKQ